MKLSASLVLYHNDPVIYEAAIRSYLDGCDGALCVVDNSSTPLQSNLFPHPRVKYIFAGRNLGFGAAHNIALRQIEYDSEVHLFLNPDVRFDGQVIPRLLTCLERDESIGAVMPRVEYEDGSLQYLCKLLPTPLDLIFRRFIPYAALRDKVNRRYELHTLNQRIASDIPNLSGCFLMVRTRLVQEVGGFDERYFMYMEDVDLVRRIGDLARTVYEPSTRITHGYAKGSYSNPLLMRYHVRSAILYFKKWGWIFDPTRRQRNSRVLANLSISADSGEK